MDGRLSDEELMASVEIEPPFVFHTIEDLIAIVDGEGLSGNTATQLSAYPSSNVSATYLWHGSIGTAPRSMSYTSLTKRER